MTESNNFKVHHMWQLAHGYNKCWTCFQGVVGEGVAAQIVEALQTGVTAAWAVNKVSFNSNQNPRGKITSGTWDFKLETRALKNESFFNLIDNYYGHIDITTNYPSGEESNFVIRDHIKAGETFTWYYEVKTLSPNNSAGYNILKGFQQATNTANLHKDEHAVSVLLVDKAAFDFAYQNGFKDKIDQAFKELRAAGGVLKLSETLTSTTRENMVELYKRVKNETSKETK